jgi:hypothetical protein
MRDGIYVINLTAGRVSCRGKIVVAGNSASIGFDNPYTVNPSGLAKLSQETVTLVFSKAGYLEKEVTASAGTSDLVVEMEAVTIGTFPASPSEVGPSNPALLEPSGTIEVSTNGTVIENVDITGYIHIRDGASNVTVRNFKITTTTYWGVFIREGSSTNILIEDGEIDGLNEGGDAVSGSNYTARRLYIHNMGGDAFKAMGNCLIEGCYVTDLGQAPGAHGDGVQGPWDAGTYPEVRIMYNNFLLNSGSLTACVFTGEYITNVPVEGNRLSGGSYTIYCHPNHHVVNNIFGRDDAYGVRTGTCGTWEGNVWADTGEPVP